ncbi:LCP family protein required for cell wall assembly [Kineosphaera limosa]|uniref:Putative LytR family regulatory protein n=1 Tax=Kineosphaera limosa NBRC 100340 TaxID=1184609 RepID=K6WFW5_9MICO|nr:LCP family protein [Kineosphaera limosa]NYE01956.1 LCP family protein required for cell wall assembly [Kineosphaera limosa]GAB98180.1 putative LytR family regulatory protein [Kineosphaera limosa NBRC 100340]
MNSPSRPDGQRYGDDRSSRSRGSRDPRDPRGGGRDGGRDARASHLDEDADYVDLRSLDSRVLAADPELLSGRLRRRRAFTLPLLTLVAPGSAQLVAGNRRVGGIALRIWFGLLAMVALAVAVFFLDRSLIIDAATNRLALTGLAVVLGLGAIGWAVLFLDALRLARLRLLPKGTRRGVAALTAALVAITAVPLTLGARNVLAGRDLVGTVFGNHASVPPSDGRYNILLLGADSGADRTGIRPDTIMLASVDADTGRSVLFGFARDTENINFRPGSTMAQLMPEGWNCGDQCLLNGLYQWGTEHKDQFPAGTQDPGAVATKEAVEALSGLDIQYYGMVDLRGFQRFIDAVGGITIDVKTRVPIGGGTSPIRGWIEPGVQTLDGYHALWYARSREGASNYERMARQRCVVTAMVNQLTPEKVFVNFQKIASVSGSILQTDIPESDLGTLGDLAMKARSQPIKSVNFVPPLINPWNYDPQVIHRTVQQTIETSKKAPTAAPRATTSPTNGSGSGSGSTSTPRSTGSGSGTAEKESAETGDLASVCSAA